MLLPSGGSGRGRQLGGESARPVRGFGTGTTGGGGLLYLSMEKQRVYHGVERAWSTPEGIVALREDEVFVFGLRRCSSGRGGWRMCVCRRVLGGEERGMLV